MPAQSSSAIFNPKLENGLDFKVFSYAYVLTEDMKDEFKFSTDQLKKLEKLKRELEAYSKTAHLKALETHDRKFRNQKKRRIFGSDLIFKESFDHYRRVRKIMTPKQRRRLDQILSWSGRGSRSARFGAWVDVEAIQKWELERDQFQRLMEAASQEQGKFDKAMQHLQQKQVRQLFAQLTIQQQTNYKKLINPNRNIEQVNNADFYPFALLTTVNREAEQDIHLQNDQYLKFRKLAQEFSQRLGEITAEMTPEEYRAADHDIIHHEVFKEEFAPKLQELFKPKQLAAVERHYIKEALRGDGPVFAIFDPAIAAKSGVSMRKLKTMKKLRKQLKLDHQKRRIELTKVGFESILKKVDRETRAKIKKTFGKPPKYVLAR